MIAKESLLSQPAEVQRSTLGMKQAVAEHSEPLLS
jgi:hypothetical protein